MNPPADSDWTSPLGLLTLTGLDGVGPAWALAIARGEKSPPEPDPPALAAARASAERLIESCEAARIMVLGFFDAGYPSRLRSIPSPPALLCLRGSLPPPDTPALAVIGTRSPTPEGEEEATRLTSAATDAGLAIISGLALGIDGVAHRAALEHGGATVAVLGSGLDAVSPARHRDLAQQIVSDGGALLSEQPPGTTPSGPTLVARNRLQTGLADALLLVESGIKGGSMHTARFAAEQGKPIYCPELPGDHQARAGLAVLLQTPARELPAVLPAWAKAKALTERIGEHPVAEAVPKDELPRWLASITPNANPPEHHGEQLSLGP